MARDCSLGVEFYRSTESYLAGFDEWIEKVD
jgi:hypothetical protein